MKTLFILLAALAIAPAAFAAEFTGPSFYRCTPQPTAIDDIDQCAQDNFVTAQNKKAPAPKYKKDATRYFYDGLVDAQKRNVTFGEKDKPLSTEDALLRRQLGEWLYFSQPNAIEDGKKVEDLGGVDLGGFATAQVYPQPDGSFVIFYWDYNGAANSSFQAARLNDKGVKLLASEEYDEAKKTVTTDPIANFNAFHFNPKTGGVVTSNFDAYNSAYTTNYTLDGDIFRLKQYKHAVLQQNGKTKTTILYKAP